MTNPSNPEQPEQKNPLYKKHDKLNPREIRSRGVSRMARRVAKEVIKERETADSQRLAELERQVLDIYHGHTQPTDGVLIVKKAPLLSPDPLDPLEEENKAKRNALEQAKDEEYAVAIQKRIAEKLLTIPAVKPNTEPRSFWRKHVERDQAYTYASQDEHRVNIHPTWVFNKDSNSGTRVEGYSLFVTKENMGASENSPKIELRVEKGKVSSIFFHWRSQDSKGGEYTVNHNTSLDPHDVLGLPQDNIINKLMHFTDTHLYPDKGYRPDSQNPYRCIELELGEFPEGDPHHIKFHKGKNPYDFIIRESFPSGSKKTKFDKKNKSFSVKNESTSSLSISRLETLQFVDTLLQYIPTERVA